MAAGSEAEGAAGNQPRRVHLVKLVNQRYHAGGGHHVQHVGFRAGQFQQGRPVIGLAELGRLLPGDLAAGLLVLLHEIVAAADTGGIVLVQHGGGFLAVVHQVFRTITFTSSPILGSVFTR